jgi:PadR family transcriptional regulator, regulatory protein PadR
MSPPTHATDDRDAGVSRFLACRIGEAHALIALSRMESSDREINFRTVAAEARVSTAWLYNQKELRDRIMRSRETPILSVSRDSGGQCHKCLSGQSVIATLRLRIKTLEAKNRELTEQLEHAYGMIAEIGQVVPSTPSRYPMIRHQIRQFEIAIVQSRSRSRILVTPPLLGDDAPLKREHSRQRQCFPLTFDKTESQTIVGYRGEGMPTSTDLLQGTLDLLILQTLALGPMHGWGVAQRIQQVSKDVLQIGQGSLYPALYRLEYKGWIRSDWGSSENNRRAKFYRLTAAGRKQLETELATWDRLSDAIALVLGRGAEASS